MVNIFTNSAKRLQLKHDAVPLATLTSIIRIFVLTNFEFIFSETWQNTSFNNINISFSFFDNLVIPV